MAPADASAQPETSAGEDSSRSVRRDPTAIVVLAILDLVLLGPIVGLGLVVVDSISAPAADGIRVGVGLIVFAVLVVVVAAGGLVLGLLSRAPRHRWRYQVALWATVLAVPLAFLVNLALAIVGVS